MTTPLQDLLNISADAKRILTEATTNQDLSVADSQRLVSLASSIKAASIRVHEAWSRQGEIAFYQSSRDELPMTAQLLELAGFQIFSSGERARKTFADYDGSSGDSHMDLVLEYTGDDWIAMLESFDERGEFEGRWGLVRSACKTVSDLEQLWSTLTMSDGPSDLMSGDDMLAERNCDPNA